MKTDRSEKGKQKHNEHHIEDNLKEYRKMANEIFKVLGEDT